MKKPKARARRECITMPVTFDQMEVIVRKNAEEVARANPVPGMTEKEVSDWLMRTSWL